MTGRAIKTNGIGKPCPEYLNRTVTMADAFISEPETPSRTMEKIRERRRYLAKRDRKYRLELRQAADRAAGLIQ